ncbi:hypothetical protein VitviT2T_007841 [Vitis vinifera]|uniref:Lipoxygenase domain-containing protein n=2 Tax=Vitis vinifera TaxID=29760 RepID=A0ABY9C1J9_VITVI|nr:hypothetical protein VitviT2T_007841 [Vitis vinifera]
MFLVLVLEIRKKTAALEPQKLQEEIANTKGRTLEGGVDEFSYAELIAIIGKLCKKLEEVENIIEFKKGETNSMNEPTVHWSHMQGLSAIQPLDIHVPMQGIFLEYDLGFLDQGTGEVEYGLGFSDKGTGTVEYANGLQGKLGKPAYLEDWITTITSLTAGESAFKVTFDWDEEIGEPGAFIIRNNHHRESAVALWLIELRQGELSAKGMCLFYLLQTYLPSETPGPLRKYREGELVNLRGDGTGELKEWDRVYDYAYYNDLGNPDRDLKYTRPVLGGSAEYPYPRRGRTGRPPSEKDPNTESILPLLMSLNIYVPRDERFGHLKMLDFLAYALKSIVQFLLPEFEALCDSTPNEFDSFQDVLDLYEGGIKVPEGTLLDKIKDNIPLEMLKELVRTDGEHLFKFPMPQVIKEDKSAWRTDEEFAREMLAGLNPVVIRLLQEFPPKSKLDLEVYGNQNSSITKEHIENHLDGLTINKAMKKKRLFILDDHDVFMPYRRRINTTSMKTYASRTLLFLKDDRTLKPLAIELSLPHPNGMVQSRGIGH